MGNSSFHSRADHVLLAAAVQIPVSLGGALALASQAIEAGDARMLFRVIDQRSRHAFAAIQQARKQAAALVRSTYPAQAQASALAQLGDAALASDPADLFARRCPKACQAELGVGLGAPVRERTVEGEAGPELEVETANGGASA